MTPSFRRLRRSAPGFRSGLTEDWRILRALTLYRLLLITLLLGLLESGVSLQLFEQVNAPLFRQINQGYAIASLLLLLPLRLQTPNIAAQTLAQFGIDLAGITALVFSTGGVENGLGILLITPTVAAALILTPRLAMVCAAAATLVMFAEEFLRPLGRGLSPTDMTGTGLLGLMLFATTIAAAAVATRARKSEALVAQADSEMASLSQLNENIIESMQTGVLVVDEQGHIRMLNAAARRLLGARGAPGQALRAAFPALADALQRWRDGRPATPQPLSSGPDTQDVMPRFSRLGWAPGSPMLVLMDDAEQLREQARQMKLAALGRLSASIAHEIRNPLAAMTHAGQLLAEDPALGPEQQRLLEMIHRHGHRIDRIVRDVLNLTRRDATQPQSLVLVETLRQIRQEYLEHPRRSERRLVVDAINPAWTIHFDPEHLQQVLHNLWDNSFEHAGDRTVSVHLRAGLDGPNVWLDVEDDGPGIPPALLERVFEPFFTTAARGTGLGLYLARELCDFNHAQLQYRHQTAGARFRIMFSSPP